VLPRQSRQSLLEFGLVSEQQVPAGESDGLEFGIRSALSRPPRSSTPGSATSPRHLIERYGVYTGNGDLVVEAGAFVRWEIGSGAGRISSTASALSSLLMLWITAIAMGMPKRRARSGFDGNPVDEVVCRRPMAGWAPVGGWTRLTRANIRRYVWFGIR
jgi:hypothetical protein